MKKPENIVGKTSEISEEEMLAYLQGSLPRERQRQIEELISDDAPEADALEGLKQLQSSEALRSTRLLQQKLHTELLKDRKRTRSISSDYWNWIAVIVILLLIVVGYVVVRIAS